MDVSLASGPIAFLLNEVLVLDDVWLRVLEFCNAREQVRIRLCSKSLCSQVEKKWIRDGIPNLLAFTPSDSSGPTAVPHFIRGVTAQLEARRWFLRAPEFAEALKTFPNLRTLVLRSSLTKNTSTWCQELSCVLPTLTRLESLDVSDNKFRAEGFRTLKLNQVHSLRSLDLSRNLITNAGAKATAQCLASLTSLSSLNLSTNTWSDEGVVDVISSLSALTELRSFTFQDNQMTPAVGPVFRSVLSQSLTCLCAIDLQNATWRDHVNWPAEERVSLWANILCGLAAIPTLQRVDLSRNPLGGMPDHLPDDIYVKDLGIFQFLFPDPDLLASPTLGPSQITHLRLANCTLSASHGRALAALMRAGVFPFLQFLDLSNNTIAEASNEIGDAIAPLFSALGAGCKKLKELHFYYNECTPEDATVLAESIPLLSKLEVLGLSYNPITARGWNAIASAICASPLRRLRHLRLTGTGLGAEGMPDVARVIKACPTLQFLFLGENGIGSAGLSTLIPVVPLLPDLHDLHLAINNMAESSDALHDASEMVRALSGNQNLRILRLAENGFGQEFIDSLRKGLAHLPFLNKTFV